MSRKGPGVPMTDTEFHMLKRGDKVFVRVSFSPPSCGAVPGTPLLFLRHYTDWCGAFRPVYDAGWDGTPMPLAHHHVERAP